VFAALVNATHLGLLSVLPNANAFQSPLADNVCPVQVTPSLLIAHASVPSAIATNNPCPYSTFDQVWLDGRPAALAYHVVPLSILYAALLPPLAIATKRPLPKATLDQVVLAGKLPPSAQTIPFALTADLLPPVLIATYQC